MSTVTPTTGFVSAVGRWLDANILALGREMRLSYLPPLMVYAAAGISGLTSIVGTFYVKERLGLSAEFLAALGFWMMLPWALKMPLGHLVDLMWRWKSLLVYMGAGLITLSLLIMIGLLGHLEAMRAVATVEAWYVTASMLAPVGYVLQDVVADAMTVEAVPRVDEHGHPLLLEYRKSMHVTMQTLGRVAIITGGILVSIVNVFVLRGVGELPELEKAAAYLYVYELALIIPLVSVCGVIFAAWLRRRDLATANGARSQPCRKCGNARRRHRSAAGKLVDFGRGTGLHCGITEHRAQPCCRGRGNYLRCFHEHRIIPDVAIDGGTGTRSAQRAGGHRRSYFRVPRHTGTGCRLNMVDD